MEFSGYLSGIHTQIVNFSFWKIQKYELHLSSSTT